MQAKLAARRTPRQGTKEEDGLIRIAGKIWVPGDDAELKLRVLVASHCGSMGHRGADATASVIREAL